jgi:hypothetical protein
MNINLPPYFDPSSVRIVRQSSEREARASQVIEACDAEGDRVTLSYTGDGEVMAAFQSCGQPAQEPFVVEDSAAHFLYSGLREASLKQGLESSNMLHLLGRQAKLMPLGFSMIDESIRRNIRRSLNVTA